MRFYRCILFCFVLLSACAQTPSRPQTSAADTGNVNALMKFAKSYAEMPAEAQKREYNQLNSRRRNEYSRMQLVMASLMPGSRYRDEARAQVLLDEHLKATDSHDEGLRSLATLLRNMLAGQARNEENALLMQKYKDEQKRADMLQHKIDELLAVEKTMSDRHEAQPK